MGIDLSLTHIKIYEIKVVFESIIPILLIVLKLFSFNWKYWIINKNGEDSDVHQEMDIEMNQPKLARPIRSVYWILKIQNYLFFIMSP